LLAAINCEEADHVPFVPSFIGPWVAEYWKSEKERMEEMLRRGLDQFVSLEAPSRFHPDVKVRLWKEHHPGEKYPLLFKVYETPAGDLRQVAVQTEDWPHGDDIPVFSDFVVAGGRSREHLIKGPKDLQKFRYLMREPSQEQVESFHEETRRIKAFANRHGLLINATGGYGGTYLPSICGMHNLLMWIIKFPDFVRGLLEIVHEWDLRRTRLALEEDPDMVTRDGWYESPVFWSIKGFKQFIKPFVQEEIELVHQAGKVFRYVMAMGNMLIADTLREMDIDVLFGIDPVIEETSPEGIRKRLGDKMCLWGGISEAVTLQQGSTKEVKRAVADAIKAFAPGGGFILSTVGSILQMEGWRRKGSTLIKTWREFGKYPIRG